MRKALTKAEEQVMQALWEVSRGGLRDIVDAMPDPKPHINTVATVLKVLSDKEFVQIEPVGRSNLYTPRVSKDEYSEQSMQYLNKNYFNGSFSNMISFLVEKKKVDLSDLEELVKHLKKSK